MLPLQAEIIFSYAWRHEQRYSMQQLLRQSRNFPHSIETKDSLLYSKQPTTCPNQSQINSVHVFTSLSFKIYFNINLPSMPKCCHQNLPLPLYRSNTLPLLDLAIIQYLKLCTNHKDYHYAILSGISVSSLLCPSIFPNSLHLNILSARTFPASETKFCTHIKQHMVFSILIFHLLLTSS